MARVSEILRMNYLTTRDEFDTADFRQRGPGSFCFAAGPLKQKAFEMENKPVMKSAPHSGWF